MLDPMLRLLHKADIPDMTLRMLETDLIETASDPRLLVR